MCRYYSYLYLHNNNNIIIYQSQVSNYNTINCISFLNIKYIIQYTYYVCTRVYSLLAHIIIYY